ncbi:MAG: hypothetical protein SPJ30_02150 [Faecalibacterium sp.]|nr:hypothetical protein [Faecalibacterium sp.]
MNIFGGSGSDGYAIVYSETPNLSFSQHTTATGSAYVCYVRVKKYTLTLYGNGGYRGSRSGAPRGSRPSSVPERTYAPRDAESAAPVAPKRTERVDDFADFSFGKIEL